jgi:hypothetical protein
VNAGLASRLAFRINKAEPSTATAATAAEFGQRSLNTVSLVFFWIAVAVWLIVVVAGLLRLAGRAKSDPG